MICNYYYTHILVTIKLVMNKEGMESTESPKKSQIWTSFDEIFLERGKSEEKKNRNKFWRKQQNEVYIDFLIKNRECIGSEKERRSNKVFKHLSNQLLFFSLEKTPEQCRGHHKKMVKRYKTIDNIIKHLQKRSRILIIEDLISQQIVEAMEKSDVQQEVSVSLQDLIIRIS